MYSLAQGHIVTKWLILDLYSLSDSKPEIFLSLTYWLPVGSLLNQLLTL